MSKNQKESLKQEVKQLQQEVKNLQHNSNKNEINYNPLLKERNNSGGQERNIEIISMISNIEQTMKTLKNFGEQLKIQLDTNLIQWGMS